MSQAVQVGFLISGYVDSSGNPLDSGTATFYESDGVTIKTIWADAAKDATLSNPVPLDSNGTANVYVDGVYDVVMKDSEGSVVETLDDLYFFPNEAATDSEIDATLYGSGDDADAISQAITAAEGADRTVYLKPKNWNIDADLTVPTNINLKYLMGAYTTVAATKTLTISGTVEAPLYNIWQGSGTVSYDNRNNDIPSIWKIGGAHDNRELDGVATVLDGLVINGTSNIPIHIQRTEDGASTELMRFDRTSASPADNDSYDVTFYHENDNDEQEDFAKIELKALDVSDGTEKGEISVYTADGVDGSMDKVATFDIDAFTSQNSIVVDNIKMDGNTIETTSGILTVKSAAGSPLHLDDALVTVDEGVINVTGEISVDNINIDGNTITSTTGNMTLKAFAGSAVYLDDSNVQVDGGAVDITGDLDVDNVNINGNTVSSSSGDLNIDSTTDTHIQRGGSDYAVCSSNGFILQKPLGLTYTLTERTISSGVITASRSFHTVDTESAAASDDLDTINGGFDGYVLVLKAKNTTRTVVVKHNTGNIQLNGSDFSLDNINDTITLVSFSGQWLQISSSSNGV